MTILKNCSDVNFITSDQPAINTQSFGQPTGVPVEEFELYYPVSPTTAVIFSENKKYTEDGGGFLSKAEVIELNKIMASSAHEQIYSRTEAELHCFGKT